MNGTQILIILKWNNSKLKGNNKFIYNKLNQKEKIELKHKGLERMRFKKEKKEEWISKRIKNYIQ